MEPRAVSGGKFGMSWGTRSVFCVKDRLAQAGHKQIWKPGGRSDGTGERLERSRTVRQCLLSNWCSRLAALTLVAGRARAS